MISWLKEKFEKLISKKVIGILVNRVFGVLTGFLLSTGLHLDVVTQFAESGTVVITAVIIYVAGELIEKFTKKDNGTFPRD